MFKHVAQARLLAALPEAVKEELRSAYGWALVVNRTLQIELGKALADLAARRVEVIPLKGVVLAARYYPELALRPASDIDLLVRPGDVALCTQALAVLGYAARGGSENLQGRHALHFLELQYTKSNGAIIELHTTLARAPSYRKSLSLPAVWARSQVRSVHGQDIRCLDVQDELRYLCLHYAAQHHAERLFWLVDVAQILDASRSAWNWDAFVQGTVASGLATPVAVTLADAAGKLGLSVPPGALDRLHAATATARERTAWQLAHAEFASVGRVSRHLLALPGPRAKLAFLREMLEAGTRMVIGKLR